MSTPIIATKLYIPQPRPNAILRPRLVERLNEGLRSKLTLISAAAGFGKTTLLATWLSKLRIENDELRKSDRGGNSQFSIFNSQFSAALSPRRASVIIAFHQNELNGKDACYRTH
jgi:LuxR family maltose regulon positive regulatory protein